MSAIQKLNCEQPTCVNALKIYKSAFVMFLFSFFRRCVLLIPQGMEPCNLLLTITTHPQVHLETLHLETLGDPTAAHLAMEPLQLLLQDPQQLQSLQWLLAMAGTRGVPKDEIGFLEKTLEVPKWPNPLSSFLQLLPSQPLLAFKIIFRDYLHQCYVG